jgi:tetratricopeptide (TPR) repeat protein
MPRDEFTTRALAEGRLDEAIRHLAEQRAADRDPRTLAWLLTQRGRFAEAETILRQDVHARLDAGSVTSDELRQLGDAAWRADHFEEALVDLREAMGREADLGKAEAIRNDISALEEQVHTLRAVDVKLRSVDRATIAVGAVLLSAILLARWTGRLGAASRGEST